jgi:hypothetical protein
MRGAALLLVIIALGCIGAQTPPEPTTITTSPTATTSTITSTTTSTATSSTSTTTTTTVPRLPDCDKLTARFWRAICYDNKAYERKDPSLCRTIYCRARLLDPQACDDVQNNATDWEAYKKRACEAWAARSAYLCRGIMKSGDCSRWYMMLEGNYSLCQFAQNTVRDDCSAEFAYWRGDMDSCHTYNTVGKRLECESNYYMMVALDNGDPWYCNGIRVPKILGECRLQANWTGPAEKHPLYGLKEQLLDV